MRSITLAAVAALLAPGAVAQNVYVTADRLLDVSTGQMIQQPAIVIQNGVIYCSRPAQFHSSPFSGRGRRTARRHAAAGPDRHARAPR